MDISQPDGLQDITYKLDEIYLCDEHTMAYMAFKDLYSYKKQLEWIQMTFWYSMNFGIKNYVNLELPCQKELKPFFLMQQMYQKKMKN